MANIIINADIYIKMLPDITTNYKVNKTNTQVHDMYGKNLLTNELVHMVPEPILEELISLKIVERITTRTNNEGIYSVFCTENSIHMLANGKNLSYANINEIDAKYLNLQRFLNQAHYIGRNLENKTERLKLLYEFNNVYLVLDDATYKIMTRTEAEKEGFMIGELLREFYDKDSTYQAVFNSIYNLGNNQLLK